MRWPVLKYCARIFQKGSVKTMKTSARISGLGSVIPNRDLSCTKHYCRKVDSGVQHS